MTETHVRKIEQDGNPALLFERHYPHGVERVWEALTDPAQLGRWFPCEVRLHLVPGGTITFLFPGEEPETGTVTEVDAPTVFAFSWAGEELRWTLSPDDSGEGSGCVLRLVNTIADPAWAPNTAAGWDSCLGALDAVLEGRTPQAHAQPDDSVIEGWRTALR
ncbi:SRPBCC family protein [Spiractinospora alimapuensis]|uniref:SRPBCC family protein n=1 Tax=Spiractinospora alimapuensis TaxID=2820884 RepID=UPI001F2B2A9E|nr:SRPBCC family protein [Spiractinospora alimapuensis]QVQ51127.1 SRPBCC family protein [Spiractinospora alimapuensis]